MHNQRTALIVSEKWQNNKNTFPHPIIVEIAYIFFQYEALFYFTYAEKCDYLGSGSILQFNLINK